MAVLSRDAQGILDGYLGRVRAALRGHTSIDVDDVEKDVQSHVEAALAGQPEPIDAVSLRAVLQQLGAPEQWAPADDLPVWRQALSRLWSGPEDWRLPYLTFICFLAAPTLFLTERGAGTGPLLWPLPLILAIASFALGRASLAVLAGDNRAIETRRWLIYPALLSWYVPLALVVIGWPIPIVLGANTDFPSVREWTRALLPEWFEGSLALTAAVALGIWWMVLGLGIDRFRSVVRAAFWPFAESLGRRHAIGTAVAGAALAITAAAVVLFIR
jgi:hypothetical protein